MDQAGLQWINDEVREAVRRSGIDPLRDRATAARMVEDVIGRYRERAWQSGEAPEIGDDIARSALDAVAGFGPLQRFFDDPEIEEIWVNEPGRIFIARGDIVYVGMTDRVRPPFSGWLITQGAYDLQVEAGATLRYRP